MDSRFIYDIPTRVYFGEDFLEHLGPELASFGKKVLLVYGGGSIKKTGLYDRVLAQIDSAGLKLTQLPGIEPNPRIDSVRKGAAICKEEGIDVILAVGGGSVLDASKFIGAAAYYDGDAWDISTASVDVTQCLPIVTVLTLSATGSEMDAGGVITNPETNEKLGMMYPVMQPKVSFLDPTNTYTVSAKQTAYGSADILSHLIEVYFDKDGDLFMLDKVMEGLFKTVIKYTAIAMAEPDNYEARANLMWASSWAINGFVAGGKMQEWSCHPIEHELSAFYDIAHGLGLAILTPRWMQYVLDETTVAKFYEFGVNVFDIDPSLEPMDVAKRSIEKLSEFLYETCSIPSTLRDIGIDETHFDEMAYKACYGGHVIQGYRPLNQEDIKTIYKMCL